MIKYFKPVFFIAGLFSLLSGSLCQGQITGIDDIATKFLQYCSAVPNEEVYLQADRSEYIAGEALWFNAYLIDRQSSGASDRSQIVYVELLNPENTPVAQQKIKIENGSGPGQFTLPDSLTTGNYTLRAYTNWMKNFLPADCFMETIRIYNFINPKSYKEKISIDKKLIRKVNIEYFPEGGNLVNGIKSKIAVKVKDTYGLGIKYTGKVQNEIGDSITSFTTNIDGIGSFDLTPEKGKTYMVFVNSSANDIYFSYLPTVLESGIVLSVNNLKKDTLEVILNSDDNYRASNSTTFHLFIQTHGVINYKATKLLPGRSTKILIPKSQLIPGINQITIFNSNGEPLCERLIYTPANDDRFITVNAPDSVNTRDNIILEIALNNIPVSSSDLTKMSISVAPETGIDNNPDIDEYLIFGTEFGKLPWATNRKLSDIPVGLIDDFLITSKSNWLSWDKIIKASPVDFKYKFEKDYHYLNAKLNLQNPTDSDIDKILFLSTPGKEAIFQSSKSDSEGIYTFNLEINEWPVDLIIQPAIIDKTASVKIESPFSGNYPYSINYPDTVTAVIPPHILKWSVNYQVGKIFGSSYVGGSVSVPSARKTHLRFYGKPDKELILADFIALPVMQEVFFELLPGVSLKLNKSIYSFSIIDPVDKRTLDFSPTLMIDGVIIDDPSLIANLDPEDVEKIDVVKTQYVVGDIIFYGIINVITKAADFSSVTLPDYAIRLPYRTFDQTLSFITPDYSSALKLQSRTPDFRNTLYWNSSINPDNAGKARIEFPASDYATNYVINIQGINANGIAFSEKKILKIK